ncbi:MAG: dTMP kinase [Geminicoccaceae bacterium]
MSGRFITFEGGEGAGKTTQLGLLRARLEATGHKVRVTREPGGTEGAEAVRRLLLEGPADAWRPLSELFLVMAARDDHLHRAIMPALADGAWVLCDRYLDSTRAYQGIAGGLGLDLVDRLHEPLSRTRLPDLTILLDIDTEAGLERAHARGQVQRFEQKGVAFLDAVRRGFLDLAAREPDRIITIPAVGPVDRVGEAVWATVRSRLLGSSP